MIERIDSETAEEIYLRRVLSDLQASYIRAAQPYIDRLVQLESLKPRRYILQMTEGMKILPFTDSPIEEPKP